MAKLPLISGKKAIRIFMRIGYQIIRKKGSHFRLHHPERKPLTVPNHRTLGKGLLRNKL